MSASAYRRSCDQLGLCQDRAHRCRTCRPRGLSPSDAPSSRPMELDALDLHRVHYVDTHDIPHGRGVSVGGMCTSQPEPHPYSEAHPNSQANKADPAARARFWRWYAISHAAAVACGIGLWLTR